MLSHCRHAIIETTFADLIDGLPAHIPSGLFFANCAWLAAAVIAHKLAQGDGARQADSRAMSSPSIGSTSLMMRSALSAARSGSSVTPSAMPSV